jgi:hypothetical protein
LDEDLMRFEDELMMTGPRLSNPSAVSGALDKKILIDSPAKSMYTHSLLQLTLCDGKYIINKRNPDIKINK